MFFKPEKIKRILEDLEKCIYSNQEPIKYYKVKLGDFKGGEYVDLNDSAWETYETGSLWGGYDVHQWFRAKVTVPESFRGKPVAFHMTTGFEGEWDAINPQFLFYVDGKATQGLDVNHREVLLGENAVPGKEYNIAFLAHGGMHERKSNLFTEIVTIDREVEELYYNIQVPYSVAVLLESEDKTRIDILNALDNAVNMIDMRKPFSDEFYDTVREANNYLKTEFYEKMCKAGAPFVTAIGHTHIDVAWLWTLGQTRKKAARSFSTVLKLMEQYPDYKFMSSQPQLYKFIKEDHPDLYEKIKEKVKEGRWETDGAMWLEADCNVTSGESLVRQILFGTRFFKNEFDKDCRVLWLPDVFGYSAALPQILKKSKINYFMTTKISWNQYNVIPYDTFNWKGIDGSEVLTHFITACDYGKKSGWTTYNGMINASQVMGTWYRYQNKEINDETLIAFGYGDGGGGATKEMLESAKRFEKGIPGAPTVKMGYAGDYFDRVYNKVKGNKRLPKWVGELYLEYHRGTYTSMARNKKYNRRSEFLYEDAEFLSALGMLSGFKYPQEIINKNWETILLNQFHDIIPGSSIREVYEESKAQYEQVLTEGKDMAESAQRHISAQIDLKQRSVVVFNTLSFVRDSIVEFAVPEGLNSLSLKDNDGTIIPCQFTGKGKALFFAKSLPSKGYKAYNIVENENVSAESSIDSSKMENSFYKVEFDENYNIKSIYDKKVDREVLKPGSRGNVLQAFEDKPMNFENWDIDIFYQDKMWEVDQVESAEVVEAGPVRYCLKVVRNFCDSKITQYIYMYTDIPRIDFKTEVDWNEKQVLLKAAFPVDVNSNRASYEIQYGNVERDTHWNTSWDVSKFEVCAHKWADLSENGYGVSLLNDCKYGHDIKDGVMRLTLIKAGTYPNVDADREHHEFTYSIYPHVGGWRDAETVKMAYDLNVPAYAVAEDAHNGSLPQELSMVKVDAENVIVEVVKKAEDSNGIVVRLYECYNRRSNVKLEFVKDLSKVYECNLMEEKERELDTENNGFAFEIKPYEIKTFLIEL